MRPRYFVVLVGFVFMAACLDRKTGNPDAAVPGGVDGAQVLPGTGGALGGDSAQAPDLPQPDGPAAPDAPIGDALPGTGGALGGGGAVGTGGLPGTGGMAGAGGGLFGTGGSQVGTGGRAGSGTGGRTGTGGTSSLSNGAPCTTGSICSSGVCADGVCCNNPCSGCSACVRSQTGQADGSCAPVTAGNDPHTFCADETATNQCGNDGQCDGTGVCRKVGTSHQCSAASCAGNTFTPASYCNGNGACTTVTPQDCGAFQCSITEGCKTTCTTQADCGSGSYCNTATGSCLAKTQPGGACTQAVACTTGSCVDGVCCENTCTGTCKACSNAKTGASNGLCRPIKVGTDPDNECNPDSSNACGLDGMCDGVGACRYQVTGTQCGTASCTGQGTYTPRGQCNGSGTCMPGSPGSCPNNMLCASSAACATTCTDRSTTGCPSGYKCVGGNSCVAAIVTCGTASCPVGNGQKCCVTNDPNVGGFNSEATYTCLPQGQSCSMSSTIECSSKAHCASGQVCCDSGFSFYYPNMWTINCTSDCYKAGGGFYYQVCDPNLTPSECQTGTCKAFAAGIPGVYACQ